MSGLFYEKEKRQWGLGDGRSSAPESDRPLSSGLGDKSLSPTPHMLVLGQDRVAARYTGASWVSLTPCSDQAFAWEFVLGLTEEP